MFEGGDTYRVQKKPHRVSVSLSGGDSVEGYLFIGTSERVLDVLNDQRKFLPVEGLSGGLIILAKSAIARVEPVDESAVERAGHYDGNNPYEILGVEAGADEATVKAAYHELIRAFHPDQMIAAGLSDAVIRLAEDRVKRITQAYRNLSRNF